MSREQHIVTRVTIDAPPAVVWRVLTDFDSYPEWNPGGRFRGTPQLGARVWLEVRQLGPLPFFIPVTITSLDPERKIGWRGGQKLLTQGVHDFELSATEDGGTEVVHGERFTGLALPLMWPLLQERLRRYYQLINDALKLRAEAQHARSGPTP